MSALELAMQLLAGNAIPFPFEDLPKRYDDPLWDKIEERYNLSLPQVSALKNEVYGKWFKCYFPEISHPIQ